MKTVRTSSESTVIYPWSLYCYKSLIEFLQRMLLREWFFETREEWRHRNVESDSLEDVHDAQLSMEFLVFDWVAFLSVPFDFALSLNVDWFQPFKHTSYSVGAVYIVVQTLPGSERFLAENMILVGVIPGPHEPHISINTYLQPLVDDLLKLWSGVTMKSTSQTSVLVRAALLCFACDILAARKVCGFLGHRANKACSKCLKSFPTKSFGDTPDYGGFDRQNWRLHTNKEHHQHAFRCCACNTQSAQDDFSREHGF